MKKVIMGCLCGSFPHRQGSEGPGPQRCLRQGGGDFRPGIFRMRADPLEW